MKIGWSSAFTINAELYPTYIRSTGVGWGNGVCKFAGIIGNILGGVLLDGGSGVEVMLLLVTGMMCAAGIGAFFLRETRWDYIKR